MEIYDGNGNKAFAPSQPSDQVLNEFKLPIEYPGLNALVIGSSVFEIEQALREGQVRSVVISIYNSSEITYDLSAIGKLIHELLIFVLAEDINVEFRLVETNQTSFDIAHHERTVSNVCLFSGGTDSFSGVLVTQQTIGDLEAIFCAHTDQARTIHIVDNMERKHLRRLALLGVLRHANTPALKEEIERALRITLAGSASTTNSVTATSAKSSCCYSCLTR